jgi:glycosyltransferase involved in cell wall biosynthesis
MAVVSAIIPVFNAASTLGQSIDSVLASRWECELEVIVIDDGSTDSTPAIARSYGEGITYIRQPKSGVAAARNRAVQESHGEYIAFLDADDYWLAADFGRPWALWPRIQGLAWRFLTTSRLVARMTLHDDY